MIFKIPEIIEYLSKYITLDPGDIIATGTPSGVGPIQPGDILEATIEHIGTLSNNVILEDVGSKSL
jgi:2-keto-4-pentenoate hydratase/2-oxohepta-3-ene-1,7-dioic acid hydratase in catechol pathway